MAFKTMTEHNEERFKGMFVLPNDGDYADVVFMYQDVNDVLVADGVHYIISPDYKGYVHCCGAGCPACNSNIRTQTRLFIPVYIVGSNVCEPGEIVFFDRSTRFEAQMQQDVFSRYPNPSQVVFRITRNGKAGDVNTRYSITAVSQNPMSYDEILAKTKSTFPDKYEDICKEVDASTLQQWISANNSSGSSGDELPVYDIPDYQVTPRGSVPIDNNTVPSVPPVGVLPATDVPPVVADAVSVAPDVVPDAAPVASTDVAPVSPTPVVSEESKSTVSEVPPTTDANVGITGSAVPEVDDVEF